MKIGLISDTHDNIPLIKKAVEFFKEKKVDFVLHAGDFIAPFSLKPLEDLEVDWRGVFGNNDGEKEGLSKASQGRITKPPLFLDFSSKKIALAHQFQELEADVIIFGHTHHPEIRKSGNLLIVNPGEAGSWLTEKSSVAILDLDSLSAEIFYL